MGFQVFDVVDNRDVLVGVDADAAPFLGRGYQPERLPLRMLRAVMATRCANWSIVRSIGKKITPLSVTENSVTFMPGTSTEGILMTVAAQVSYPKTRRISFPLW